MKKTIYLASTALALGAALASTPAHADATADCNQAVDAQNAPIAGTTECGINSSVTATDATAVGAGSTASHTNSVAIGAGTVTTATSQVNVGNRTIGGVGAGVLANDAATVGQVQAAVDSETQQRVLADVQLQANITAEANARALADATLQTQINNNNAQLHAEVDANTADITAIEGRLDGNSVHLGSGSTASNNAVAIGVGQTANGSGAVAIGDPNVVNGTGAVGIGGDNTVTGTGAVGIGNSNTANGTGAVALGNSSTANGSGAVALGNGASSTTANSVAIGTTSIARGDTSIAIGNGAVAGPLAGGATLDHDGVAIGDKAQSTGFHSTAIGGEAVASGAGSQAFGWKANATGTQAAAVGNQAQATGAASTALGNLANASGANSTALGNGALASGANSTAIGQGASTAGFANSVALGTGTVATAANQVNVGGRTIGGVAVGALNATSTDAINGSQLFATNNRVTGLEDGVATLFDLRSRDRRDMKQGVASAMAMAQAPMPSNPGGISYAVNGAMFRAEFATGGSLMYRLNTENAMAVSVGVSFAGNKNNGARVGFAGEF